MSFVFGGSSFSLFFVLFFRLSSSQETPLKIVKTRKSRNASVFFSLFQVA